MLCECGCGMETRIAATTQRRDGQFKGQPMRFIHGHNRRKPNEHVEYRRLKIKLGLGSAGQVKIHRLRAERALGHPLPLRAEVHHADGSRDEDAPLVICQDRRYHQLLHSRMRVIAHGGDPNADSMCSVCQQPKPFSAFAKGASPYGCNHTCRECLKVKNREFKRRRRDGDGPRAVE